MPLVDRALQGDHAHIKQNLFWAYIYNILGIPLAAGILYPFMGVLLNPVFAALAFSSVSVVSNALRLRAFRPPHVAAVASPPEVTAVSGYAVGNLSHK